MNKIKHKSIIILSTLFLCLMIFIGYKQGFFTPVMQINGKKTMIIEAGDTYAEAGANAIYKGKDISEQIQISGEVDTNKIGSYEIIYQLNKKETKRIIHVEDHTPPEFINLKKTVRIFAGSEYKEEEIKANDNIDLDVTQNIKKEGNIDTTKQGTYEITYTVQDTSGNITKETVTIEVIPDPSQTKVAYNHDTFDNKSEQWWFKKSENHERNEGARTQEFLKQYDAYYLGKDEKVIYLTFDEGGIPGTYVKQITDVLNQNQVKATFFFTLNYIRDNVDYMKELIAQGHLIANHSWHHYNMTNLANAQGIDDFVKEVTQCEKIYYELLGQPMEKIFRFPKGEMSERSLKIMKDLGYRTYFWSHAYYDFSGDVSKEKAYKTMMDHYHNGAIYLLHPSNKGNYEALDDFIKNMKKEGYRFELVNEIQ